MFLDTEHMLGRRFSQGQVIIQEAIFYVGWL